MEDGIALTSTEAQQAGRSHLIDGNTIYSAYNVLVEPAPKWIFDKFICKGTIAGKEIKWEEPYELDTRVNYYRDLQPVQALWSSPTWIRKALVSDIEIYIK